MNTENNILIADFVDFVKTSVRNIKGKKYDYQLPNNFLLIKEVETTIESVWCEVLEEQDYCMVSDLKFDTDWNWLMEVVEKIETISNGSQFYIIVEYDNREEFKGWFWRIDHFIKTLKSNDERVKTKKLATYNACVEFIKWYNQQKL